MKNVLVVCDNFTKGGLETQIYTLYNELKDKVNFTFIFGYYNNSWDFGDSIIYDNIGFNENATINQFNELVVKYIDIIKKHEIEIIHAHPFLSVIPAIFAAQLTKTPICYSYHGFSSISFPTTINIQTIFNYSLNEIFSKTFCSYKVVVERLNKELFNCKNVLLYNPIDINKFKKAKISKNGKWAMTCRMSSDKIDSIEYIINSLDNLAIEQLHLYGTGEQENYIKSLIKEKSLNNRVFLHSYSNNIQDVLLHGFNGLIGMGRSASEGISMQLPVMIVGYGKNCGIVDKNNYEELKNSNFAPIFSTSLSNEIVKKQVEMLKTENYISDIYKKFSNECSSKIIAKQYFEEIDKCEANTRSNLIYMFKEIEKIKSNEIFSSSKTIYDLVRKYLKTQSLDINMNLTMNYYDDIYNKMLNYINKNEQNEIKIKRLEERVDSLSQIISDVYDHMNIKYIMYKTKEKIKEKLKRD